MYLDFYNLKKHPFRITPDPEFLYLSPSHREALATIIYGVDQRKGFVTITGEVGVGKTTILRSYIEGLGGKQRLRVIYIFNADASFKSLLKSVLEELGLEKTDDSFQMVNQLHNFLIEEYRQGRNVVLIIDEAQNMPIDTLESLRMLSNLETATDKLIQIVLIGQPELEKKLNLKELRQIRQRISVKTTILPLTKRESLEYIQHRLRKAVAGDAVIFTKQAMNEIVRESRGIPRIINILCDNALVTGYGYQKKKISARIVREVVVDRRGKKRSPLRRWLLASLVLFLLVLACSSFWVSPYKDLVLSKLKAWFPMQAYHSRVTTSSIGPVSSPDTEVLAVPVTGIPATSSVEKQEEIGWRIKGASKGIPPFTRIVSKGDTLSSLVEEVYGHSDKKLLEYVLKNNPNIEVIDKILVGQEISFPQLEQEKGSD
jgi:general secretion pathway protein A